MFLTAHPWQDAPLTELAELYGKRPEALAEEMSRQPPGIERVAWWAADQRAWIAAAVLAELPREDALLLTRFAHRLGTREEAIRAGLTSAAARAEEAKLTEVRFAVPAGRDALWRSLERRGFSLAGSWLVFRAPSLDAAGPVPAGLSVQTIDQVGEARYLALANAAFAEARGAVPVDEAGWRAFRGSSSFDPLAVWVLCDDEGPCAYVRARIEDGRAFIGGIGVLDRARGRGLARWLLRTAAAGLAARGALEVGLQVWSGNVAAVALYESEGMSSSHVDQVELVVPRATLDAGLQAQGS